MLNNFFYLLFIKFTKFLFVLLVYLVYGVITLSVLFAIDKFTDLSGFSTYKLEYSLSSILGHLFALYLYIYISLFNIISVISFLIWSKFRVFDNFTSFFKKCLVVLFISYLSVLMIFLISGEDIFLRGNLPPMLGGLKDSGIFIGNIVISTVLFYSWFLPLWYYKLGDWFWQRGKWAKNYMQ